MSRNVLVLLSAYNGGNKIIRQVESIILQEEVNVSLFIRDDGSDIDNINILRQLEKKYPRKNLLHIWCKPWLQTKFYGTYLHGLSQF